MHSVASDGEVIFHSLAVGDLVEASQKVLNTQIIFH